MGNNLSSIAPLQVYSHEYYISQLRIKLPRLTCIKILNSARFLKSVLCQLGGRDCVVKVFVLIEQNQDLKPYKDEIDYIRERLQSSPNCIPYYTIESSDRAAFLIRPYEKTNLYDRISMRPFLSIIEKKWIAFQILTALKQCHDLKVCHGDIKMENILVTTSLWIYLTDFATFKPVLLPEDDPADYYYFFDPSWRRLGYVAPERFFNSVHGTVTGKCIEEAVLTPAMDIFSAGCVLAELFAETPLFTLPSLFRYMAGDYYPEEILSQIEDEGIKGMVINMISKDPSERKSATQFLNEEKGKIFPKNFYEFLWTLMAQNRQNEDGVTALLPAMMEAFTRMKLPNTEDCFEDNEVFTIFASIIASNLENIKDGEGRMIAMQILGILAGLVPQNILNDTILPAVVYLVKYVEESSTALALHTLKLCISKYHTVPKTCPNIFPDCIYPCINEAVRKENFFVRRGVAENIGYFADISHDFLIFCMVNKYTISYPQGKRTLDDAVSKIVGYIFCDPISSVRRAIANHSIEQLCMFFGQHKASDALMSHLITYLNEKKDFLLRMSFYPSIVTVALNVAYHPAQLIKPLLLQGLSDVEESIAAVAVQAMEQLVLKKQFRRTHLCSIIQHVSVLLIHPNIWIRASVIRLISVICQNQPVIMVMALIKPRLLPFLSRDMVMLEDETVLWLSIKPTVPRSIYEEFLKKGTRVSLLLSTMINYSTVVPYKEQGRLTMTNEDLKDADQKHAVRRLLAYGITTDILNSIDFMKEHIHKVKFNQKNVDAFFNIALKEPTNKPDIPTTTVCITNEVLRSMYLKIPNNPLNIASTLSENERNYEVFSHNLGLNNASQKRLNACLRSKISAFPFDHQPYKRQVSRTPKIVDKDWHPEGKLIAHLHEHTDGVTRMTEIPGKTFYCSASRDGTCKIWDCAKAEGKYPVNKSKGTYCAQGKGNLISLACCSGGEIIAFGDHKGALEIFKLDRLCQSNINHLTDNDYMATDMAFMELGSSKVLTYSTPYSNIYGWDLRTKSISFALKNNIKIGPITSYVISPCQTYLVYGTSFGYLVCWDLRCRMPVSQIRNSAGCDVRRIKLHPTNPSMVVTAMTNNNEIDFYGLEFKTKSKILWASPASPMKSNVPVKHNATEEEQINSSVSGLHVGHTKSGDIFVLSGGMDAKLRYWNISHPEESKYLCNSFTGGRPSHKIPFTSREVNGTEYIIENFSHKKPLPSSEHKNNTPIQPFPGHKDHITDILMVHEPKTMIISSSMDGVIKVWK